MSDDPRSIWQGQPTAPSRLSPDELRAKASRFERGIWWRNAREYVAAIAVALIFGWHVFTAPTLWSLVGNALVVTGSIYVAYRLRRSGSADAPTPDALAAGCVAFHRRALEKQRDLLRSVWRWYLGPLVPGLVVLLGERASEAAKRGEVAGVAVSVSVTMAVFLMVGWLNAYAARKLDAELAALDGP